MRTGFTSHFERFGNALENFGIYLTSPFWHCEEKLGRCYLPLLPGKYSQKERAVEEIFWRVVNHCIYIPLGICSISSAILGQGLVYLGGFWKQHSYQVSIYPSQHAANCVISKIMHLNACMFPGSLPLHFGGMRPAKERLGQLHDLIVERQPELLLLSEIQALSSDALLDILGRAFQCSYSHIGMKFFGFESCLFIASKVPMVTYPRFKPFLAQGSRFFRRGYVHMQFTNVDLFFTHIQVAEKSNEQEIAMQQLEEISRKMHEISSTKNVLLIGDLNIDYLKYPEFFSSCRLKFVDATSDAVLETYTKSLENFLQRKIERDENRVLDFALQRSIDNQQGEISFTKTYFKPSERGFDRSLSDHKALMLSLKV